jgi:hypothetical protein
VLAAIGRGGTIRSSIEFAGVTMDLKGKADPRRPTTVRRQAGLHPVVASLLACLVALPLWVLHSHKGIAEHPECAICLTIGIHSWVLPVDVQQAPPRSVDYAGDVRDPQAPALGDSKGGRPAPRGPPLS